MHVINRRGELENVEFDRILKRIQSLCYNLNPLVDAASIAQAVINGMFAGITTTELDELAAQTCAYMAAIHPDFSKLAARIAISNLHKNTSSKFDEVIEALYFYKDHLGRDASLISDEVYEFVMQNKDRLNAAIDYNRDFEYDYFAFKTLERSYLHRVNRKIVERPQHMLMRVACGINLECIERVVETYELMSQKFFIHATPTLFNSGTRKPQMSSCFLLTMKEDSIMGIYDTLKDCALISKTAGGIGLAVHDIRCSGSYIKGTNGFSNGIVPMLRVFNMTARYVDQGGGKRKGSIAVYLEPWHADIYEFLDLRKNHGAEELRARDLFCALWIPDLFMQRVEANSTWSLFDPNYALGLSDVHSEKFNELYEKYEKEGIAKKVVKAQHLWFAILQSQIETGTPYMLYKDSCNRKSNQSNLGTIKCSNLCTEIVQYTSPNEIAVCNLASISLPKYVKNKITKERISSDAIKKTNTINNEKNKKLDLNNIEKAVEELYAYVDDLEFDFEELHKVTKVICYNLNKIIDRNYYPVEEARRSNMTHRPIGIGIQGLADVFMKFRIPFDSEEARILNQEIFETIYHAAVEQSVELAEIHGPYSSYKNSPISFGKLQFDLWNDERLTKQNPLPPIKLSGRYDWDILRAKIQKYGIRNSLLIAPMPTASTSQILGNIESFEPCTSNIYSRRVLSGEFFVVNQYLLSDLIALNLWNEQIKNKFIGNNGSIQTISEIPGRLKNIYKTVWEIKQKHILDMAADRAPFIDQSQSLNIYISNPNYSKLTSMHFYGWKLGLKTGQYYLRTTAATDPIKFTVDQTLLKNEEKKEPANNMLLLTSVKSTPNPVCKLRRNSNEPCLSCSG